MTEALAIDGHRASFTYRGLPTYQDNYGNPNNWRPRRRMLPCAQREGRLSGQLSDCEDADHPQRQLARSPASPTASLLRSRRPAGLEHERVTEAAAIYAQDTWTLKRLTLQGALRFDRAWSFIPANNGTDDDHPYIAAPISFDRTAGMISYKDISPRVGAAYDVFGNAKTAIKANFGRYLSPATNDQNYPLNNPANRIRTTLQRNWTDTATTSWTATS